MLTPSASQQLATQAVGVDQDAQGRISIERTQCHVYAWRVTGNEVVVQRPVRGLLICQLRLQRWQSFVQSLVVERGVGAGAPRPGTREPLLQFVLGLLVPIAK